MGGAPLKPFIARRIEAVKNQLAGKSEGYTPTNFGPGGGRGFGPGGPGGPGGFGPDGPGAMMRFGPGGFLATPIFKAADKNNDAKLTLVEFTNAAGNWFTNWDSANKRSLETESLANGLNTLIGPPPGYEPSPEMPPPPDGGPGMFLADSLLRNADANGDQKLTQIEFKAAFGKWFKQWDADKSLALEEAELGKGLSQLFRPPAAVEPSTKAGKAGKVTPPAAAKSRAKK